jgi:hypothetical protein
MLKSLIVRVVDFSIRPAFWIIALILVFALGSAAGRPEA